jgi:colicin import membrane protein
MEMARIALAESRGEMTKEEAIFAKEKVRTEADARKQTAAIAMEEGKVAESRRKAAAEDAQANQKRAAAQELQRKGVGMLTDEEKKAVEANKESIKAGMEQSKIDQERFAKQGGAMGKYNLEKERAAYAEMQAAMDRESAKLAADKAARDATGAASPKALRDTIAGQIQAANEGAGRASALRGEALAGESGIRQSQQIFGMRQATGAMQAQAQIEAERARKQAEAEKAAADRAREVGQVGTAGGALASTLAGDGISTGFTDSLRKAAGGAGDAAGLDRLIAMVAKLTANSSKLSEQAKSKLDKLEAEIEDLRTAK